MGEAEVSNDKALAWVKNLAETKFPKGSMEKPVFIGSEKSWGEALFYPQVFSENHRYTSISVTSLCCADMRYVVEGTEVVTGALASHVPGKSLAEKLAFLRDMTTQTEIQLNATGTFFRTAVQQGEALAIPAGYLVVIYADADTHGLRWPIFHDNNGLLMRMVETLKALFDQYPENKTPTYKSWYDWLVDAASD